MNSQDHHTGNGCPTAWESGTLELVDEEETVPWVLLCVTVMAPKSRAPLMMVVDPRLQSWYMRLG